MRALITCLTAVGLFVYSAVSYADKDRDSFALSLANEFNLDQSLTLAVLSKAAIDPRVIEAIKKPWEAKPWHQYAPIFLTEKRRIAGINFWQTNSAVLQQVEKETGVPAEIIVAILGIESFYGEYKGSYPVLNSLYTLASQYQRRSQFFKSELAQFIQLCEEQQFAVNEISGSYAGAIGWPQFIPSSYRHYAVDHDEDGVKDLIDSPEDTIASIANYLAKNGWQRGRPIAFPVELSGENAPPKIKRSLKYSDTWQKLQKAGVTLTNPLDIPLDEKVKLFEFAQRQTKEYWLGLYNFYVITRYNHSPLYARVVFEFSQQLKQEINKT